MKFVYKDIISYLCPMRILLVLLFMSFGTCYGQFVYKTPYMVRMDSLAVANLGSGFSFSPSVDKGVKTFSPSKYVKFTFKTSVNVSMFRVLNDVDGLNELVDELEADDYISLGKYDIRMKVYLSKDVRFIGGMVITGIQSTNYSYNAGLILKF